MRSRYREDEIRRIMKLSQNLSLNNRQISFMLILTIILSILLRLYGLNRESLWLDEAVSVEMSYKNVMVMIASTSYDVHPPLYYFILHYWITLFGDTEFMLRLLSVVFGVLSIYVIYRLGKYIFNKEVGLIGAFILSISLYDIIYSQEARSYTLLILLILLSNYYFLKIINEYQKKDFMGYILSTVAALYTHIFALLYLMFQTLYMVLFYLVSHKIGKETNIRHLTGLMAAQVLILLLFSPWVPVLTRQVADSAKTGNHIDWIEKPTLLNIYNTFKSFSGTETILYMLIIIFVISSVITLIFFREKDKRNNKKEFIFLLLWLFIPILATFLISIIIRPIYVDKYIIASMPALTLLASKAIFTFKKTLIIISILIILTFFTIAPIEKYYETPSKDQWRLAANYIKNNEKSEDMIVILNPGYMQIPFRYYYRNYSKIREMYVADGIDRIAKGMNEVWIVTSYESLNSKELERVNKIMSAAYSQHYVTRLIGLRLDRYMI